MSEKEGELKKRVLLIIGKGSLEPLLSPLAVGNRLGDILGEVFEILDEAKKEFLMAANIDNSSTISRNEIAIWEWFKRNFGEAVKEL